MASTDPQHSDESLPISTAQFVALVVGLIVVGTAIGFAAFVLFGNAEERPDTEFEFEQFGASDQQVAITNVSGERIEDPGTVVVSVDGDRIGNNSGHDWANSENGIGPGSAAYIGYNDSVGYVLTDDRSDPRLQRGLPPETEIRIVWLSATSDSAAELATYEVERRDG